MKTLYFRSNQELSNKTHIAYFWIFTLKDIRKRHKTDKQNKVSFASWLSKAFWLRYFEKWPRYLRRELGRCLLFFLFTKQSARYFRRKFRAHQGRGPRCMWVGKKFGTLVSYLKKLHAYKAKEMLIWSRI